MIRLSIKLLELAGCDVRAAGGPAYCCGSAHDHQPHGASNMAGRTVSRFNEAATKDGRGTVVTWCASCHMHMSDIMAPGNTVAFDITHISELLVPSIDRLAPLLTFPVLSLVYSMVVRTAQAATLTAMLSSSRMVSHSR